MFSSVEPMAVFQAAWPCSWPCFHGPSPYMLAGHCVSYSGFGYVSVPSVVPPDCNTATAKLHTAYNRRVLLNRSVFDLVNAHLYLSLTDQKLLGWYLCLSREDRTLIQDEGGFHQFLRKHPALDVSRHHVYVKYNIQGTGPAKPAMTTQNKSRRKKCACEEELNKLPSPLRETMSLLSCCRDMDEPPSQQYPHEQLVQMQDSFQTAFSYYSCQDPNQPKAQKGPSLFELHKEGASCQMTPSSSSALCEDPAAPGSFSVDMEPERCGQEEKPKLWSWTKLTEGQSANISHPEISELQSDWSTLEHDSSKYYSFDSVQADSFQFTDNRVSEPVKLEELSSKAAGMDHLIYNEKGDMDDKEALLSCGDSNSNLTSMMKDDQSILAAFMPREESAETFTPAPPPATKRDVMVGTESAQRTSAFTNTEAPGSSDKHVNTEVYMSDLDYLTKEFIKLKKAEEELKEKMKSPGCKWRKECECFQRAQQAELGLLALQYNMCRQHCWRLFCTSAEGDHLSQGQKDPAANISSIVQQLESDFNQMKAEILAGVPLKQLKPLSVDCGRITTGGSYIPAQVIVDVLEKVSQTPQTSSQEKGCGQSRTSSQRKESNEAKKAVTLLLQDKNTIPNAQKKMEETQKAACKELNSSEAWYDAEEDLQPETGQDATKDEPSVKHSGKPAEERKFLIHVGSPAGESQNQASDSTSSPERKPVSQPPLSSSTRNMKVVCSSPLAKGTCLPQYYCTMGGLDRLMSELKQRHPEVSRQRIVDALISLRAKHHGTLSGLPLRAIIDMTSEFLTSQQQHSDVEALL